MLLAPMLLTVAVISTLRTEEGQPSNPEPSPASRKTEGIHVLRTYARELWFSGSMEIISILGCCGEASSCGTQKISQERP